ncbi:MAG: hypothetical protein QME76_07225 [Bacillota bacterium]|nr:hypothetical protein [Bacillota bacterium]
MLMVLFLLGLTFPAWANIGWTYPKYPPSIYAQANHSDYTFQHYTEFRYDEGAGPRGPLATGWSSVFNPPDEYLQGWTAVGQDDDAYSKVQSYLSVLGVPFVDGYYIVSPAFWSTQGTIPGTISPMLPSAANSEALSVPVYTEKNNTGLTLGFDTIDNPKCFVNGPGGQGFEAGGYHGAQGYHWRSRSENSPIAVTQKAATKMWTGARTTWARICYSYLYNVTASGVQANGAPQNGKQRWTAYFFQTTPFLARDVVLRAYIVQNGKYTLTASTTTDIGPVALGNGRGGLMQPQVSPRYGPGVRQNGVTGGAAPMTNTIAWDFEAGIPSGSYKLVVSANLQFTESGTMLPEPLTTKTAYGIGGADVPPLTGTKQEVKPSITWHGSNPYDDNWVDATGQGWQPPAPGGGPLGPNDLAVTDLQILDAATGQPVTSPQTNQNLKVKATFQSSFNVGGYARLRLYRYQGEYSRMTQSSATVNMYFEPGATKTYEWSPGNVGTGLYKFIASIDYYNNGNDPSSGWQTEKFDGKYDESSYGNNKIEKALTGTDAPAYEPQPREESQPMWYPPLVRKEVPVYETVKEPVYGWKKVRFIKEEAKGQIRVRLVPEEAAPASGP